MGLDSYSKRSLDQVKNDSQVVDEIEQMNLDPDLKAKLREAKMNLEMEQTILEEVQNERERIINEINNNPKQNIDSMLFSDINLNSSSSQLTQQEESTPIYGQRYSEEEVKQTKERIEEFNKVGQDLLAMLEDAIKREDAINQANEFDSIEEEHSMRHR